MTGWLQLTPEQRRTTNKLAMEADPELMIFVENVSLVTVSGETITCQLTMHRAKRAWTFEEIRIES